MPSHAFYAHEVFRYFSAIYRYAMTPYLSLSPSQVISHYAYYYAWCELAWFLTFLQGRHKLLHYALYFLLLWDFKIISMDYRFHIQASIYDIAITLLAFSILLFMPLFHYSFSQVFSSLCFPFHQTACIPISSPRDISFHFFGIIFFTILDDFDDSSFLPSASKSFYSGIPATFDFSFRLMLIISDISFCARFLYIFSPVFIFASYYITSMVLRYLPVSHTTLFLYRMPLHTDMIFTYTRQEFPFAARASFAFSLIHFLTYHFDSRLYQLPFHFFVSLSIYFSFSPWAQSAELMIP